MPLDPVPFCDTKALRPSGDILMMLGELEETGTVATTEFELVFIIDTLFEL